MRRTITRSARGVRPSRRQQSGAQTSHRTAVFRVGPSPGQQCEGKTPTRAASRARKTLTRTIGEAQDARTGSSETSKTLTREAVRCVRPSWEQHHDGHDTCGSNRGSRGQGHTRRRGSYAATMGRAQGARRTGPPSRYGTTMAGQAAIRKGKTLASSWQQNSPPWWQWGYQAVANLVAMG